MAAPSGPSKRVGDRWAARAPRASAAAQPGGKEVEVGGVRV